VLLLVVISGGGQLAKSKWVNFFHSSAEGRGGDHLHCIHIHHHHHTTHTILHHHGLPAPSMSEK